MSQENAKLNEYLSIKERAKLKPKRNKGNSQTFTFSQLGHNDIMTFGLYKLECKNKKMYIKLKSDSFSSQSEVILLSCCDIKGQSSDYKSVSHERLETFLSGCGIAGIGCYGTTPWFQYVSLCACAERDGSMTDKSVTCHVVQHKPCNLTSLTSEKQKPIEPL